MSLQDYVIDALKAVEFKLSKYLIEIATSSCGIFPQNFIIFPILVRERDDVNNPDIDFAPEMAQKLHGYGTWENRLTGTNFSGYFKQDKFHGFGNLVEKNGFYVGNFLNSNKFGYGVYDELMTGNKFMGMWHENKKHGSGVYITMDGSYFEENL